MLARIHSATMVGIEAIKCEVEIDVGQGGFEHTMIVGLPDAAVKESLERVRSAVNNSGYPYPYDSSIINLAPADIKKEGPRFDLAIALGMLMGQGVLQPELTTETVVVGELALDGRVRPVRGALATALMTSQKGCKRLLLPQANAREAAVVQDIDVIGVSSLTEAVSYLNGELPLNPESINIDEVFTQASSYDIDFSDVKGQESAKRALTIAAAGNHNILMMGPPGTGKTMLTKRLPTIMPPLSMAESLETTQIHSAVGLLKEGQALLARRPVRSPHHSASGPALVGGGSVPRPGELSLAHNGLLFLDEFPEFKRSVLETIRQPLEDGYITISRAAGTITFPANIMLVAAMNPCPCGYLTDPRRQCKCSPNQVERYLAKISGPLLDRIDIHIDVPAVPFKDLSGKQTGTTSAQMLAAVQTARKQQQKRFNNSNNSNHSSKTYSNANMNTRQLREFCQLDDEGTNMIKHAVYEMGLSARAYDKVLKIARTIADMEQQENIKPHHVAEAIQYRRLDRNI